ncbi:MAG: ZIP family metal transporter [Nanoarchaeota archaeon]|nr:ZIP family metal transporter [Nanoarchaeota archaeon]MBU1622722.1 ZIP family metal transporter [Nanoarchaeota archaeon]MBU1974086.1 ZIP family metal transporter [Nanoarchaeota archaeon]
MTHIVLYTLISVIIVSLISLVGIFFLLLKKDLLNKTLLFMVSLSAGSLFGGAFIHLLPEAIAVRGFTLPISLSILGGILVFFVIEKAIHWRHCHIPTSHSHPHHLATMNLIGDGVHNFIDGLIIAAGYIVSPAVGVAATIAVILHEVPQEISDFGVLLYSGLSKAKALFFNFLSASIAIAGALIGLIIGTRSELFALLILPFAAGGFLYIAGSDLIPELHKNCVGKDNIMHFLALVLGIAIMLLLKLFA